MNTIKDDGLNVVYQNSDSYLFGSRTTPNEIFATQINTIDGDLPPNVVKICVNTDNFGVSGLISDDKGISSILFSSENGVSTTGLFVGTDYVNILTAQNSITVNDKTSLSNGDYVVGSTTITIEGGLIVGIS